MKMILGRAMDSPEDLAEYLKYQENGQNVYKDNLELFLDGSFLTTCPVLDIIYNQLRRLVDIDRSPLTQLYVSQIRQVRDMGIGPDSDEEIARLLYNNYGDINKILNMMGYK